LIEVINFNFNLRYCIQRQKGTASTVGFP